jgi:hypothetical protein
MHDGSPQQLLSVPCTFPPKGYKQRTNVLLRCVEQVMDTCTAKGIAAGVFCLGQARAASFAAQGYEYIAYDVDLNVLITYGAETTAALRQEQL